MFPRAVVVNDRRKWKRQDGVALLRSVLHGLCGWLLFSLGRLIPERPSSLMSRPSRL